ncbi:hypothetical protein V6N12_072431 [Hibiscus sabdariffa]|uniref:Late embryogenesis abundant protein LEA-2 subgroup domain-containing protein n=1 Tax=Hibiscus sabdariffa TaxID=183260 RepID=A0ABR2FMZ6_9ROSI
MPASNAGVPAQTTQQQPRGRFSLVRCVATCLLALIVVVGLAVLITWLVINPKKWVYTLENGSVQNFNLTNNHLNATFDFVLRAHNPNRRLSVYYDHIESTVTYEDQTIAFNTMDPFFQPHRNVSRVKSKLVALNLAMSPSTSKDLMIEKTSREIQVDVHYKTRIRLKLGRWKSSHRTLRIVCYSVTIQLSRYKHFDKSEHDGQKKHHLFGHQIRGRCKLLSTYCAIKKVNSKLSRVFGDFKNVMAMQTLINDEKMKTN